MKVYNNGVYRDMTEREISEIQAATADEKFRSIDEILADLERLKAELETISLNGEEIANGN